MSTQVVQCKLYFQDGSCGLFNGTNGDGGANTDGTAAELKSDVDFYVVASSAGTQFPNRTVIGASVQGATFVSYAYILDRAGNVGAMLPPSSRASGNPYPAAAIARPYTLQPGDTIQVMTAA
jgi:hypothetical protein